MFHALDQLLNGSPSKNHKTPRVICIVGSGVSGLAAAWHLALHTPSDQPIRILLCDEAPRVGGHAHTIQVQVPGKQQQQQTTTNHTDTTKPPPPMTSVAVDIGFMVFNDGNYPNMRKWFQALGQPPQRSSIMRQKTQKTTNMETDDVESKEERDNSDFLLDLEEYTDMSLAISLDDGTVEWNSTGLNGLLGNRWQALRPSFYQYITDMLHFNAHASTLLQLPTDDPRRHVTTLQYVQGQNLQNYVYSQAFCVYYLLPMMAALWSASLHDCLEYPACQLIGFLANHKMLQLFQRPVWKTVKGRSQVYVEKVLQDLQNSQKVEVYTNTPIVSIQRTTQGLSTLDDPDFTHLPPTYNVWTKHHKLVARGVTDIVFACPPNVALEILQNGNVLSSSLNDTTSADLADVLSSICHDDNVLYVHSDPALMPRRKRAWASWNCIGKTDELLSRTIATSHDKGALEGAASGFGNTFTKINISDAEETSSSDEESDTASASLLEGVDGRMKAVYVTYWLNRLQNLESQTDTDIFVSLNPHQRPADHLIHKRLIMAHPQFTKETLAARTTLLEPASKGGLQGKDGLWFCGAWAGYGFHEDGCRSGFEVATQMTGVPLPWRQDVPVTSENDDQDLMVLPPPDLSHVSTMGPVHRFWNCLKQKIFRDLPIAICKPFIYYFLRQAVQIGTLRLKFNDGSLVSFGDGSPCGYGDNEPVTLRIFDDWFFVKTAWEYDLGLARSYMAGYFNVEPLEDPSLYDPVIRPPTAREETTVAIGDPIGLTRLFLLLIGNRDRPLPVHIPRKAGKGHFYSNALSNASGLIISRIGSLLNFLRYKILMDNSERGGSLKNIHAHYNLSNDLFRTFLDKDTLMYSSAIYDAVKAPSPYKGLAFRGTLEEAQWRKLDTLLDRAQIQPGQTMLDIGFGWGGLSIHAAKKYGCQVTGITLSKEQKALAEERVKAEGLESLITFEIVDYRVFARRKENRGKFDRVLSCEMIEAVGHEHLGEFFWAVEQVLAQDGILVMEAITTPEQRYETYKRSTDFINTIIFPGSCCPSLHALVDAAYKESCLTLEHIDNIGLHYAQTLAEWRRRFNEKEAVVRQLGFDDIFLRVWNYYLTYCEAGFFTQTENCLILVFSRQGCCSLTPLCETRSVTQAAPLTKRQVQNWLSDSGQSGLF